MEICIDISYKDDILEQISTHYIAVRLQASWSALKADGATEKFSFWNF